VRELAKVEDDLDDTEAAAIWLADDRERLLARVAELERQLAIVNALAGEPAPYVHTVTTSGTFPEDTNASR